MSLDDAFLDDIIDHPADDAPRLVYADWLEEHGDPESIALAEFIRVQMALETPPEEGPELWALRQREEQLLRDGRVAWRGRIRELALNEVFRRGFIHTVTMEPGHFLDRAEEVFALAPVQGLRLTVPYSRKSREGGGSAPTEVLASVARSPYLRRVTHLTLDLRLGEEDAKALADSPYLAGLVELEINAPDLTLASLRPLLASPARAALRSLSLSTRAFEATAAEALAVPSLGGLHTLRLRTHRSGAGLALAEALASSPHLRRLRVLDLGHNQLSAEAMRALARASFVPNLEELGLANNGMSDGAVCAWVNRADASRLRRLDLPHNGLRAAGFEALADCATMPALHTLDLRSNVGGGPGLAALAASENLPELSVLLLHFNGITDDGLAALARSEMMTRLVWLDLMTNRIGDAGARELLTLGPGRLARLELARNDIDPELQKILRGRFAGAITF